jgi:hypothetical protein
MRCQLLRNSGAGQRAGVFGDVARAPYKFNALDFQAVKMVALQRILYLKWID